MPDFTEENEKLEDPVPSIDPESQFKAERDELYDRLLRKQAEFDNYKKRVERERSEYVQYASAELMRELLNAMDSFDLAIHNASSDSGGDNMLRGLDLIYKQFQDTLARFGLKAIEARGQVFDPNLHQAVSTVPTDDVPENTVVDELRKGYTLNGRLLRPVMVTVSVRS
ncbi:MAG TPA: nucleotide exchange factor GrpE [Terriglobia bacterium]|nr:nucleotide exchange factor GrpE [Terriglobia bacterium]